MTRSYIVDKAADPYETPKIRSSSNDYGPMRLGIFGGSFDPIHNGHLTLATRCRDQAALDEVWFMPAARQPLKPRGPQASDNNRCAMIELAISGHERLRLCRLEIDRGGLSYTVDTLRVIHEDDPQARLYFLMGADSLSDLPNWHEPSAICQLATPLVVQRDGEPVPNYELLRSVLPPSAWRELQNLRVDMPAIPVSSSEIRRRIAKGDRIDRLVPANVAAYIAEHRLYRNNL